MNQRLARSKQVTRAIVREIRAENITFMAGSIAYHAFVSLLPFLLLVLFVLSQVGGPELAQRFIEAIAENITPTGSTASGDFATLLVEAATNATRNRGLSLLSLAILVWGTLRIFRGLDQAFSDIYESHAANTFLDQVLDAVVVFVAIGTALFLVTAAEQLVGTPSVGVLDAVVRPVVSALTLAIAFYPMYYVFPDEDVSLREVVPGSLIAGTGWTALRYGFGLYTSLSSTSEYGLVGVIILLITWLYFGGLVLLLGAAVNAVLAGRSEDVDSIAWGQPIDADPTHDDAAFVTPLRELETVAFDGDVRIVVDGADVTVPAPNDATVTVRTVDRPWLLGGDKETAEVYLRWDNSD
ncbi:YihY/virulence factor BrkB family protein [Natronomonas gomsonensis]|uniref:YihY/virulence factor BrkB family protein n=1 Tax=Natronomonas gomsonensis TaxID=1046043 RepID=UPI0020CA6B14|nr:YihY/virulence factor BrkB family protein [Natronomonas gomsonensis]MCY4732063.1 YihY/virulence factor BrkB family protein [Natronomonas gomsonensis]